MGCVQGSRHISICIRTINRCSTCACCHSSRHCVLLTHNHTHFDTQKPSWYSERRSLGWCALIIMASASASFVDRLRGRLLRVEGSQEAIGSLSKYIQMQKSRADTVVEVSHRAKQCNATPTAMITFNNDKTTNPGVVGRVHHGGATLPTAAAAVPCQRCHPRVTLHHASVLGRVSQGTHNNKPYLFVG